MLDDVPTIQADLSTARKAFMDRAYEWKAEAAKISDSLSNKQLGSLRLLPQLWHDY
jgi:hypothetical protein